MLDSLSIATYSMVLAHNVIDRILKCDPKSIEWQGNHIVFQPDSAICFVVAKFPATQCYLYVETACLNPGLKSPLR